MDKFDLVLTYLRPAAEIAILFFIIYGVLFYLRSTRGSLVIFGLSFAWIFLSLLAKVCRFMVIGRLFELIGSSLVVILFVLFQPELRRLLAQLGSYAYWQGRRRREMIGEIVTACSNMSRRKCGALIVIESRIRLQMLVDDAVPLDDKVLAPVLESIFYPGAPLHDGAVIIRGDRIIAARAILPLTRSKDISPRLGTRHRAALGISEESDAVTVIVSEETGSISLSHRNSVHRDLTGDELAKLLETLLVLKDDDEFAEAAKLIEVQSEKLHREAAAAPESVVEPEAVAAPESVVEPAVAAGEGGSEA